MLERKQMAKYQRFGALGSLGVAVGIMLFWLVLFGWFLPQQVSTGGLDDVHAWMTRLTTFFPALLIALAHLTFARQLRTAAVRNSQ